ncbi:hypothetical protein [Edaphobacter flagellatus]|uniref:hypothetical protein n=1 Tax=Edaphobacter flagellatus TaxID=1933044 RepID=UPI0021B20DF4|nr:hypothetical protein [Edaphobacter flagellatus]
MQTLGLSSKPQPADNLFKRLFWPAIESQYDVDLLGQQGFWVCTVIALMSLVLLSIMGTPIAALLTALTFFLGGCGVRQRSTAASLLVCLLYLANFVGGMIVGSPGNPFIQAVVVMLLFANVRATILSRHWMAQSAEPLDQEIPERLTETITDKFSNILPSRIWPIGRYVFYPLVAIMLLLTIVGLAAMKTQAGIHRTASPTTEQIEISPKN